MDAIVDLCVAFLLWRARVTGTTCKQIRGYSVEGPRASSSSSRSPESSAA